MIFNRIIIYETRRNLLLRTIYIKPISISILPPNFVPKKLNPADSACHRTYTAASADNRPSIPADTTSPRSKRPCSPRIVSAQQRRCINPKSRHVAASPPQFPEATAASQRLYGISQEREILSPERVCPR